MTTTVTDCLTINHHGRASSTSSMYAMGHSRLALITVVAAVPKLLSCDVAKVVITNVALSRISRHEKLFIGVDLR